MIVVDIETSGLDFNRCGIWQIGVIDLDNMEEFIEEARIDDEDVIEEGALKVTDINEEGYRSKEKQSQKELIKHFLLWTEKRKNTNFICENPQFDWGFISVKIRKYGLKINFHHRRFDLHSISHVKYFELNKKFLIKEANGKNWSDMSLPNNLKFCGIPDERRKVEGGIIINEGKPHNALEDCRLEAECFSRLVYGKNLISKYAKFPIPDYLKKNKNQNK